MAVDNLEQLSDEELLKLANESDGLENLSDDDLIKMAGEPKQIEQKTPERKTLWQALGVDVQPQKIYPEGSQAQQNIIEHPYLSALAKSAQDVLTIPAHFANQRLLNYPRAALNKAGIEFPETDNPVANVAAKTAGAAGLAQSGVGLVKAFGLNPLGVGASAALYADTEKPLDVTQNIGEFVLGAGTAGVFQYASKLIKEIPKIRIHTPGWIEKQAKAGQTVADGIQDTLGNAYGKFYGKFGSTPVNAEKINQIIQSSNIDDIVKNEINELTGGVIDTVDKARIVTDILNKRTPNAYHMAGGTIGKGGLTNTKIVQKKVYHAIKDEIREGIGSIDKRAASELKNLDEFASKKVYPHLDRMRSIFGKKEIPNTEGMAKTYNPFNIGAASSQRSIRRIPEISNEFKSYITNEYQNDLSQLTKNARELISNMNRFQVRQVGKKVGGAGLFTYLGYKGLQGMK